MIGFELEVPNFDPEDVGAGLQLIPREYAHLADGCGYLWEYRSLPKTTALEAAFDLFHNIQLAGAATPYLDIRRNHPERWRLPHGSVNLALREGYRKDWKGEIFSVYGGPVRPLPANTAQAGIHVHFSDVNPSYDQHCKCGRTHSVTPSRLPLNMPLIIRRLDEKYRDQIRGAKRLTGLYRMKTWGFEYRSLPCNVNVVELAEFIDKEVLK